MKLDIQQAIIELNQLAQGGVYRQREVHAVDVIDSCDGNLREAVHVYDPTLIEPLMFILNNAALLVEALTQVPTVVDYIEAKMGHTPAPMTQEQEEDLDGSLNIIFGIDGGGELELPESAYTNFPLWDAETELAMFEKIAPGYLGDHEYTPSMAKDEYGRHVIDHVRAAWMGWQKRAQLAHRRPIDMLVAAHAQAISENPYAYLEIAYSRSTGWMAWLCTNVITRDKNRRVLACGSGGNVDQACLNAVRRMKHAS